jgi:putative PIN family toxin of toxin-antitoxin system
MNDLRVVFDTSVVVSAVLLPRSVPRQAFDLVVAHGRVQISAATIVELEEVLRRPKFDRYLRREEREEFLASLAQQAQRVPATEVVTLCRDPKDNKFLELALSAQATYLVTGDRDLLVLHPFRGIPILTPTVFVEILAKNTAEEPHGPTI